MRTSNSGFIVPEGVEHPWKPATEQEVREVESKLGMPLPDDYRGFLKTVNGVWAVSPMLEIPMKTRNGEDDEPWVVGKLYSISKDAEEHDFLLSHQQAYQFDQRVPKRFIIIGGTFGTDQICMSLAEPDRGKVFYWVPSGEGNEEPWEENTTKYLWPAASSFREFWSKLRVAKDDE